MASKSKASPLRPWNDDNPIIDTTPPPRLSPGIQERRKSTRVMRVTAELMQEQHNECYWCGILMWHPRIRTGVPVDDQEQHNRATFDHKLPASRGGAVSKENGVAACWYCNNHRGDMPFEEYEKWPPDEQPAALPVPAQGRG